MVNHYVDIDYVEDENEYADIRAYCDVMGLEMLILEEHGCNGHPVVRLTGHPDKLRRALIDMTYEVEAHQILEIHRR